MSLSLHGERKGPKERHLRKGPTVPSLGNHPPHLRAPSAMRLRGLIAQIVAVCHKAELVGGAPTNSVSDLFGSTHSFSLPDRENFGLKQRASSARTAFCRSCGFSGLGDLTRDQPILRAAKWVRCSGGGFLKGGTVGASLKGRSLGTFLSPRTERCKTYSSINPNLKQSFSGNCNRKTPP